MKVRKVHDDVGSIMVLGIGLAVVLLSVVTIAVNVTSMWVTRSTLNAIADGAALAGAQAVDLDDVYVHGIKSQLSLDPDLANAKIRSYLNTPQVQNQLTGLRLVDVQVAQNSVWVTISATPHVPFGYFVPTGELVARSRARGVNQVR